MKLPLHISLISVMFSLQNFLHHDAMMSGKKAAANSTVPAIKAAPGIYQDAFDDLAGTWKLRREVFDDNGNRVPDASEMKKGFKNNYVLQLNSDGTCRIQQIYTGRYEKKAEGGRNMLYVYRKKVEPEETKDPIPDVYQITSSKKTELVLQLIVAGEPSSFWFFDRIK